MGRPVRSKYYKVFVLGLTVSLLLPLLYFMVDPNPARNNGNPSQLIQERDHIAAEISNMTGAKVEHVLTLKQSGLTWNQVLDKLKIKGTAEAVTSSVPEARPLLDTGLQKDILAQLSKQGVGTDEILQAKSLGERVEFQLQELVKGPIKTDTPVSLDMLASSEDKLSQTFSKIAEQFDLNSSIYYMVTLKKDLGSEEAVLDEYLLSLQLDIDFATYLKDKKAYVKTKEEKMVGLLREQVVTTQLIELTMLERLQQQNGAAKDNKRTDSSKVNGGLPAHQQVKNVIPDVSTPQVEEVRPPNPAEQIKAEIEAINPNKM
ncbi:hypothetical protein MH117_13485 [Paenibacillus sp. ACRRX]|uniref:hypothetical protein n=1 Tax=Paenibacillus sp. ACRRX TaxID=2918206 RepID=UPI001EF5E444|nr:hypothetical protein [Paenibacillus sp. ACRRX]MCG7408437.1 hypothetical protein [Paenibacillus sp. ACRRX]